MIEISFVKINYLKNNKFTINVNSVSDLLPNSNDQLDLLIDGITNNKDFINKNEKIILNKNTYYNSNIIDKFLISLSNLLKRLRFKSI